MEGTDCSGKETQSKLLIESLNKEGIKTEYYSFPNYKCPTGKIIGLPYLGKSYLARDLVLEHTETVKMRLKEMYKDNYNEELVTKALSLVAEEIGVGWFPEGAPNVDAKVASAYYATDRAYNLPIMNSILESGTNLVVDRYMYSNMAHQGGKIADPEKRRELYEWDRKLEMEMFNLPPSDIRIFLHMPTDYTKLLKQDREEQLDEHEKSTTHLENAEKAYLEIASLFDFATIDCIYGRSNPIKKSDIKTLDDISKEVFSTVTRKLTR